MAEWFSIEVFDAVSSARGWADSYGDNIVQAGLSEGALNWEWNHFPWGTVLEIEFVDEAAFERFMALAAVQAALDAVPDRVNGLLVYRGRGGSSGAPRPRRPVPRAGSGAVAVPLPEPEPDDADLGWAVHGQPAWLVAAGGAERPTGAPRAGADGPNVRFVQDSGGLDRYRQRHETTSCTRGTGRGGHGGVFGLLPQARCRHPTRG